MDLRVIALKKKQCNNHENNRYQINQLLFSATVLESLQLCGEKRQQQQHDESCFPNNIVHANRGSVFPKRWVSSVYSLSFHFNVWIAWSGEMESDMLRLGFRDVDIVLTRLANIKRLELSFLSLFLFSWEWHFESSI